MLRFSVSSLISQAHRPTVKCSLTQKCQGVKLHLAAAVYNALWSCLIRICDTSQLFLFCLLGIWIMKQPSLKGAFRFSIFSVLHFSKKSISIFLLCKFIWSRQGLRGFQFWVSLARWGYIRKWCLIFTLLCVMVNNSSPPHSIFSLFHYFFVSCLSFIPNNQTCQSTVDMHWDENFKWQARATDATIVNPLKVGIRDL